MTMVEVELFFEGVLATEIEDGEGNFFSDFDENFGAHRLKGTEKLNQDELTKFVKDNLKVVFDGELDNPDDFKSYRVKEVDGPSGAYYDGAMHFGSLSVILEVEITSDDTDEIDFDDLFHAIIFELTDGSMTFTFTEFQNYHSHVLTDE